MFYISLVLVSEFRCMYTSYSLGNANARRKIAEDRRHAGSIDPRPHIIPSLFVKGIGNTGWPPLVKNKLFVYLAVER